MIQDAGVTRGEGGGGGSLLGTDTAENQLPEFRQIPDPPYHHPLGKQKDRTHQRLITGKEVEPEAWLT